MMNEQTLRKIEQQLEDESRIMRLSELYNFSFGVMRGTKKQ